MKMKKFSKSLKEFSLVRVGKSICFISEISDDREYIMVSLDGQDKYLKRCEVVVISAKGLKKL